MATHEEAIVMGAHEDHRAGHEAKEVVAAPAAALRLDEMMRRHLGGAPTPDVHGD
jgi:hypothetical protein